MKRFSIAAIVAALALFPSLEVRGQTPNSSVPPGLPASLPMFATTNQMLDWVATNQAVFPSMILYYTAKDGSSWGYPNLAVSTNFSSWANYMEFFVSTMFELENKVLATNGDPNGIANPNAQIRVYARLKTDDEHYNLSLIQGTNTSMGNMTSNWLKTLTPVIHLQIPVPNLQQFTIQVNGLYTNTWDGSSQMPTIPLYPPEWTSAGWLVLNPWYCLLSSTNEARFSVTAGGKTQVYTQTGAPLLPPVLSMLNPANIQIAMTPGSDTTVQFTDNLANGWQTLSTIAGLTNTGTMTASVSQLLQIKGNKVPPSPQRFFRAFSN